MKESLKFQKHGICDVTYVVCRHLYRISITSNINNRELRHRTEKRFSLS